MRAAGTTPPRVAVLHGRKAQERRGRLILRRARHTRKIEQQRDARALDRRHRRAPAGTLAGAGLQGLVIPARQVRGQIANLLVIDEDHNGRQIEPIIWFRRKRCRESGREALDAFDVRKAGGDRNVRHRIAGHLWHCTGVPSEVNEIAERIAAARRLTVLTGAGVSAASGVPIFDRSGHCGAG